MSFPLRINYVQYFSMSWTLGVKTAKKLLSIYHQEKLHGKSIQKGLNLGKVSKTIFFTNKGQKWPKWLSRAV